MMKVSAAPDTDPDLSLPRFASCIRHGRSCPTLDASKDAPGRTSCPACQSLLRYGTNSLDAPDAGIGDWGLGIRGKREIMATLIAAILLFGFYLMLERSNARLDAAVSRIETVSR